MLTPPYDLDAERAVLGAILMDRDAIIAVEPLIDQAAFYLEKHAHIYTAALACLRRREPPDLALVAAELRRTERLESIGGLSALVDLAQATPTAVHAEYYAQIVARAATLRRLIETGGKISAIGLGNPDDLDAALDRAESELFAVTQGRTHNSADGADLDSILGDWLAGIEARMSGEVLSGPPTGWAGLDSRYILERGMFHIWAARPGVGKTAIALNLAANVAATGARVAFVSLEMQREALANRLAAMIAEVNADDLRRGALNERTLRLITEAAGRMSNWRTSSGLSSLYVCDRFSMTATGIRGHLRREHARHPFDLVIVDHLGIIASKGKSENRNIEMSDISRGFVHLARELGSPILGLSQLNRSIEGRAVKTPQLSDLRDSGSLEQDAASVVFLHRPEMGERLELHIAKQRNGPLGIQEMYYDARTTKISEHGYSKAEGYDDL